MNEISLLGEVQPFVTALANAVTAAPVTGSKPVANACYMHALAFINSVAKPTLA